MPKMTKLKKTAALITTLLLILVLMTPFVIGRLEEVNGVPPIDSNYTTVLDKKISEAENILGINNMQKDYKKNGNLSIPAREINEKVESMEKITISDKDLVSENKDNKNKKKGGVVGINFNISNLNPDIEMEETEDKAIITRIIDLFLSLWR